MTAVRREPRDSRPQRAFAGRDANIAGRDQVIFNLPATRHEDQLVSGLLPRDVPIFVGRERELAQLTALAGGGSVLVTAIDGTPGVGKTALAVHVAHKLLPQFPDGHLYADLRGYTSAQSPAAPAEILELFLRELGLRPRDIPASVDDRSGMLRSILAKRRVLLLLDNAASAAQVRPLLPGAGNSLVIVTSRSVLPGLDADDRIKLGVLPSAEATALLVGMIGEARARADPEVLEQVRASCGDLPLALRIAGQILAVHQPWPVAKLVRLLANEHDRLDHLTAGDLAVRAAFEVSYRHLRSGEARMFRLLGLYPGPNFDGFAAAILVNVNPKTAEAVLDRLVESCLVTETASGSYAMHDLLRLFARETCGDTDSQAACDAAELRIVDYFIFLARATELVIDGRARVGLGINVKGIDLGYHITSPEEAISLFESNRISMVGAVRLAAERGWHENVHELCKHIGEPLLMLRHLDDLLDIAQLAVSIGQDVTDPSSFMNALGYLGVAYTELAQYEEAVKCCQDALAGFRSTGDRSSQGRMLNSLGTVFLHQELAWKAVTAYQEGLTAFRDAHDRRGEAQVLTNLATAFSRSDEAEKAIDCYDQALRIFQDIHDKRGIGQVLLNLGVAHSELGQAGRSISYTDRALTAFKEAGDRNNEASAEANLATLYRHLGQVNESISHYQEAVDIYRSIGDRRSESNMLEQLGSVYHTLSQLDNAARCWTEAATASREAGDDAEAVRLGQFAAKAGTQARRWRHRLFPFVH